MLSFKMPYTGYVASIHYNYNNSTIDEANINPSFKIDIILVVYNIKAIFV